MKWSIFFCIHVMVLFVVFVSFDPVFGEPDTSFRASSRPFTPSNETLQIQQKQNMLYQFINSKLRGRHGVFTNYRDTDQSAQLATGHEVLSESEGLLLRYFVKTNQRSAFDREWALVKRTLNLASGFSYRYSPKLPKRYSTNAAVDDLRIIRALYEAASTFKNTTYKNEADTYAKRFYTYNTKNGYVYDFYDASYQMTNQSIMLCYIDLTTLQRLPGPLDQQRQLYSNMLSVIQNGYVSHIFPFYETRYQYDTHSYHSENINTVESLLTILALVEVNQQKPESIVYLKEQVRSGTLYGQYTREGIPTNTIQSTAIYALTAMIGSELDDQELYENSIQRMSQFQVNNADSPLYGSFGDTKSQTVYSFDNLMALLAFSY
ncbi:hypothetical protein BVG16_09420 [Paenibacillus selenitireducens]|uniref:Glycosyl hydrolase n=1 Tax=Paenibacillus selenitireducens TaxID=1324314 RepID=A0A1T2XHD1_9BACL|nr:hypothetical protein [Paenibacillus selenitireducens]OPA79297.1 hypothetical protein BVG16_09420 [Paenibacillus selenitireducens]